MKLDLQYKKKKTTKLETKEERQYEQKRELKAIQIMQKIVNIQS